MIQILDISIIKTTISFTDQIQNPRSHIKEVLNNDGPRPSI